MQPERIDNKTISITFRVAETDYQDMILMMERLNYKSTSKFVRDAIFKRLTKPIAIPYSAERIREGIILFTRQLNKIGSNYNQNVRRIHTLSEMKRKNGDPVIGTKYLFNIEEQNKKIMEKIQRTQNELDAFLKAAFEKMESHIVSIYSTSDELFQSFKDLLVLPVYPVENGQVSLKEYIFSHEDAYDAFSKLLASICKLEDLAKNFENTKHTL